MRKSVIHLKLMQRCWLPLLYGSVLQSAALPLVLLILIWGWRAQNFLVIIQKCTDLGLKEFLTGSSDLSSFTVFVVSTEIAVVTTKVKG